MALPEYLRITPTSIRDPSLSQVFSFQYWPPCCRLCGKTHISCHPGLLYPVRVLHMSLVSSWIFLVLFLQIDGQFQPRKSMCGSKCLYSHILLRSIFTLFVQVVLT